MEPGVYHISIRQGATFTLPLTWKAKADDDSEAVIVDLTGYSARMMVRKTAGSDVVLELTTTNSGIALGGTSGTITLTISATDSAALPSMDGVYDIELLSGDRVIPILTGTFNVVREITR